MFKVKASVVRIQAENLKQILIFCSYPVKTYKKEHVKWVLLSVSALCDISNNVFKITKTAAF